MGVWETLHTDGLYPFHIRSFEHLETADMVAGWSPTMCVSNCDQLLGSHIYWQRLTRGINAVFLEHELPVLSENVPLVIHCQKHYQHDAAVGSSSSVWINRFLIDGSVLTVHRIGRHGHRITTHYTTVCGVNMTCIVYAQKVNTIEELLRTIASAAVLLLKVTSSLVTRVRKYIHAYRLSVWLTL
jgi:hypothetical protein